MPDCRRTIGRLLRQGTGSQHWHMAELGDGLTLTALIAGTLEYAILMRHRAVRRYELLMDASIAEAGLRGLVRVVLIDEQIRRRPRRLFRRLRRPALRSSS